MTIVERDRLYENDLLDLFTGDGTAAIRIPNYVDPDVSGDLALRLTSSRVFAYRPNFGAVGWTGQGLDEGRVNAEVHLRYEREATSWIQELRASCMPFQPPIDRLRLELDEIWPAGAQLGVIAGKKMFVGLSVRFDEGSYQEPHQDILDWHLTPIRQRPGVLSQLAGIVYLVVPVRGGELTLWAESLDRDEYDHRRIPGSFGIDRQKLKEPIAAFLPRSGELVLFNSTRVHAVAQIECGSRITTTCFIGYRGKEQPLFLWS